jgi:hypothetical protein
MQLRASATIEIARPREVVFDFSCACETYVKLFRPRGPIAGIAKAEMISGAPLAAGARRRIELSDGAVVEEDVLAFDRRPDIPTDASAAHGLPSTTQDL